MKPNRAPIKVEVDITLLVTGVAKGKKMPRADAERFADGFAKVAGAMADPANREKLVEMLMNTPIEDGTE
jgi:hypothetical protein